MKVLVTGATGFVGQYLIKMLVEQGYDVCCLVRSEKTAQNLRAYSNVTLYFGDILKKETLMNLPKDVDYVIHMAAKGVVEAVSDQDFNEFLNMNAMGTKNLLELYRDNSKLKKFVHFSSTAAMGYINMPVLSEKSMPNPVTPYQKSKQFSEQVVNKAHKEWNIPTVILRPCMIYGVGGSKGEFVKFCRLMKKGIFPKVGFGKNLTPMVYVSDVARAACLALENGVPGNTYIISDEQSYSLDDIRAKVMTVLDIKKPYIFVPKFLALAGAKIVEVLSKLLHKVPIVTYSNMRSTVTDRTFDISKANNELQYYPEIHLDEGVEKSVLWYEEQKLI